MTEPSYKDWFVGMKVVCVDASSTRLPHKLEEQKIYVLEQIKQATFRDCHHSHTFINAVGVKVPGAWLGARDWFAAHRFRPLVTRKTDISCFTALLNPAKGKVEA